MTDGAIAKTRRIQIVKSRRNRHAYYAADGNRRETRMALQTHQANLLTDQHAWIHRSMRFMATVTAFKAYRGVFKREWPAFVAMASHASAVIGGKGLSHRLGVAAMRVVAIHTQDMAPSGSFLWCEVSERLPKHWCGRRRTFH